MTLESPWSRLGCTGFAGEFARDPPRSTADGNPGSPVRQLDVKRYLASLIDAADPLQSARLAVLSTLIFHSSQFPAFAKPQNFRRTHSHMLHAKPPSRSVSFTVLLIPSPFDSASYRNWRLIVALSWTDSITSYSWSLSSLVFSPTLHGRSAYKAAYPIWSLYGCTLYTTSSRIFRSDGTLLDSLGRNHEMRTFSTGYCLQALGRPVKLDTAVRMFR
ncbi:hypothetical protein C8R47DRAFT_763546 [Mycena vitilis]|nr:hypothetical protein C8R47DRAFT_763546 [Mycena vitilis]